MPVNESKAPTSRKRQKIGPNLFGRDGPFQVIREVQGKAGQRYLRVPETRFVPFMPRLCTRG